MKEILTRLEQMGITPVDKDMRFLFTARIEKYDAVDEHGNNIIAWYRILGSKAAYWGAAGNWHDPEAGLAVLSSSPNKKQLTHAQAKTMFRELEECKEADEYHAVQEDLRRNEEEAERVRDEKEKEEIEANHARFSEQLSQCYDCVDHEYLRQKGFAKITQGVLLQNRNGAIVVPMIRTGKVWGLQYIFIDEASKKPQKRYANGSKKKGAYFSIGNLDKNAAQIMVVEGVATGLTVSKISGFPVVCAMDAGNLQHTVELLREEYPGTIITVAADNDQKTIENAGLTKAIECNVNVVAPDCGTDVVSKDWNDVMCEHGAEYARKMFEAEMADPFHDGETSGIVPPGNFRLQGNKIVKFIPPTNKSDGGEVVVCSAMRVLYCGLEQGIVSEGTNYTGVAQILLENKRLKIVLFSYKACMTTGEGGIASFMSNEGVVVENPQLFAELINLWRPHRKARFVNKAGWTGKDHKEFCIPGRGCIGRRVGEPVSIFSGGNKSRRTFMSSGTFSEWKEHIGKFCVGNSRVLFALGVAASSVLKSILSLPRNTGFICHLYGPSSTGKTTVSKIAASLWGGIDFIRQWHGTLNSLEYTAAERSDVGIIMDEIQELKDHYLGEVVYELSNGQGKDRLDSSARPKETRTWRLNALSNGEYPILARINNIARSNGNALKETTGGQSVRVLDIPPCKNGTFFENSHGMGAGEFVRMLGKSVNKYYGTAGREFVAWVIKNPDVVLAGQRAAENPLAKFASDRGLSIQKARVIGSFVEVLTALLLLSEKGAGILPIGNDQCYEAVKRTMTDWMEKEANEVDTSKLHEDIAIIERTRNFIEKHRNKLVPLRDMAEKRFGENYGYIKQEKTMAGRSEDEAFTFKDARYYITDEAFDQYIVGASGDTKRAIEVLLSEGIAVKGDGKHRKVRVLVYGIMKRYYCIDAQALGDNSSGAADDDTPIASAYRESNEQQRGMTY